jgi:DNA-binding NarL/FixJ family response regulator
MKDMLRFHLKDVEVDGALSAKAALQLLRVTNYHAVISDIKLPGIDDSGAGMRDHWKPDLADWPGGACFIKRT